MYQQLKIFLIIGFTLIIALAGYSEGTKNKATPLVEHGYIDLSEWDFINDGTVTIEGEWDFYWDTLISPNNFPVSIEPLYPYFPSLWSDIEINEESLSNFGYATYRARIIIGKTEHLLALKLPDYYTSYKLWLNGKILSENGKVGTTKK